MHGKTSGFTRKVCKLAHPLQRNSLNKIDKDRLETDNKGTNIDPLRVFSSIPFHEQFSIR